MGIVFGLRPSFCCSWMAVQQDVLSRCRMVRRLYPLCRLVEVGGLKAVLPVFMGRGAARKLRKKVGLQFRWYSTK